MLLVEWMRANGLTLAAAALRLKYRSPGSLYNIVVGHHVPRAWKMQEIVEATGGAVTPNDLYECWRKRHDGKAYIKREFESKATRGPASMRSV